MDTQENITCKTDTTGNKNLRHFITIYSRKTKYVPKNTKRVYTLQLFSKES